MFLAWDFSLTTSSKFCVDCHSVLILSQSRVGFYVVFREIDLRIYRNFDVFFHRYLIGLGEICFTL